jgi:hypothetical protein
METHMENCTLHQQKFSVTVWTGAAEDTLLGLCFRFTRLTGAVYHDLLQISPLDTMQDGSMQQC